MTKEPEFNFGEFPDFMLPFISRSTLGPAPMHKWLTGFDRYNKELPFYIEKPFNDEEVELLRSAIYQHKKRSSEANYVKVPGEHEQFNSGDSRFDPKKIIHMSRELIEFECPPEIEAIMDSYAKPIHKDPIRLTHYNYIEYDLIHGDGRYAPSLPPHLDADENLVTFNYCLSSNVEGWDVWVDDKPYDLKPGDALVFSAVNQVHWRPKRYWKPGEKVEIVSFDYCPVTNYRWTGHDNPIDPFLYPEAREAYGEEVDAHPANKAAWKIYNEMGNEIGIPGDEIAAFAELD